MFILPLRVRESHIGVLHFGETWDDVVRNVLRGENIAYVVDYGNVPKGRALDSEIQDRTEERCETYLFSVYLIV